jgi:3-oxoacyl-[acyl-carrier protein] reductase
MRSIVVTGGSRGLGLAIATRLAAGGDQVIAIARTESAALAEARERLDGALRFHAADLADLAAFPRLARELREAHGSIHGLVNNAGLGTSGILATMADARIAELVHLNVTSPITLTKYLVRPMMAARAGRVVNIASVIASTGTSGLAAYGATKAALVGFTRSLARELGPLGITVNAVAPGFIETDLTHGMDAAQREQTVRRSALRRLAEPEDVAATVAFLLSDQAANITGTVITVDAGSTA